MSLLFDFLHIAAALLTKMSAKKITIYTTAQYLMELIGQHDSYCLASTNMENKADVIEALLGAFRGRWCKDLLQLESPLGKMILGVPLTCSFIVYLHTRACVLGRVFVMSYFCQLFFHFFNPFVVNSFNFLFILLCRNF